MGVNVPSSGSTSKPWRGRSRSRIICGRSSETTYEQTEMWKPGNTSSVTAAPPTHVAALEHQHTAACACQIGRMRQAVVAPADHDGVVVNCTEIYNLRARN